MTRVVHPGITLNERFKARGISQREFASIIDIAHSHLSDILNGKKHINPSIAVSLEAAGFGKAETWMNAQIKFLIQELRSNLEVVKKSVAISEWKDYIQFIPAQYFKNHGVISDDVIKNVETINNLYGVNNTIELKDKINNFTFTRYRKSSALQLEKQNVIAWETLAEFKLRSVKIENKFKLKFKNELISELNTIFYKNNGTIDKVKKILPKYGIKFTTLDRPSKTPVDGKTFKVDNDPAICLTLKYKRLDNFAFTLLHEIGHVYHHISQGNEYNDGFYSDFKSDELVKEEAEADKFATDALIPQEEWDKFYYKFDFSDVSILRFSNKVKVHPAIIRGRVCHIHNEYYSKRTAINKDNTTS